MAVKIVAVCGGGDWYDASVEHVEIDADADMESLLKEYRKSPHCGKDYISFPDWLIREGKAKPADVECFHEC